MNTFLLILIGAPALEIIVMIKIGAKIGTINTILLIMLTAVLGIYCARIAGLNTIRSGLKNIYQNKTPVFEVFSGASISLAAILLIIPGFISDSLGFILLFPLTRKIIINSFLKKKTNQNNFERDVLDGEIIEDKNKKEDEL